MGRADLSCANHGGGAYRESPKRRHRTARAALPTRRRESSIGADGSKVIHAGGCGRVAGPQCGRLPCPGGELGTQARARGVRFASSSEIDSDRCVGHPPRFHGRAGQASRVPGPGPYGRSDRRGLHGPRWRSERPVDARARCSDPAEIGTRTPRRLDKQQALKVFSTQSDLEVRFNGEWLDMPMSDLFALGCAQRPSRRSSSATIFSQALHGLRADLDARSALPAASGIRLGGRARRRRAGRDRPEVQPRCSAATSSAPMGSPSQVILTVPLLAGTDGERKMSKSYGNVHRRDRQSRGDVRAHAEHPGRVTGRAGTRCCSARRRIADLSRAQRQAGACVLMRARRALPQRRRSGRGGAGVRPGPGAAGVAR